MLIIFSAFHTADNVVENYALFMSKTDDSEAMIKEKLKVWQSVLELCEESETLFEKILTTTNIKPWILELLKNSESPYFLKAVELANNVWNGDGHEDLRNKIAGEISSQELGRYKVRNFFLIEEAIYFCRF